MITLAKKIVVNFNFKQWNPTILGSLFYRVEYWVYVLRADGSLVDVEACFIHTFGEKN